MLLIAYPDKEVPALITSVDFEDGSDRISVWTRFVYTIDGQQYNDSELRFFDNKRRAEANSLFSLHKKREETKESITCYVPQWKAFSGSASLAPQSHGKRAALAFFGGVGAIFIGIRMLSMAWVSSKGSEQESPSKPVVTEPIRQPTSSRSVPQVKPLAGQADNIPPRVKPVEGSGSKQWTSGGVRLRCHGCSREWEMSDEASAKFRAVEFVVLPACPKCGGQRYAVN